MKINGRQIMTAARNAVSVSDIVNHPELLIVNGKEHLDSVLLEFGNYYSRCLKKAWDIPHAQQQLLRVSGFPYCPLKEWYGIAMQTNGRQEFGMNYYTKVGTAVHELIQAWMGEGGQLYGSWKCTKVGCTGVRNFSALRACPKCRSKMEYIEFHVKAFKNVSGHIDGVFRTESGRWFIIDYKTSSVKAIKSNKETGYLPYKANVYQIEAYCALVEREYDIKIDGWILMYVARDNPMQTFLPTGGLVSEKKKKTLLKRIERWDSQFSAVRRIKKFSDLLAIVEDKPCPDMEYYKENYKKISDCPMSVGGMCFNEKKLVPFLKNAWKELNG